MPLNKAFFRRAVVAVIVLTVTLIVSAIWQKMVYTIPVLAVLLFLAAGIKNDDGSTKRNLDEVDVDVGGEFTN